MNILYLCDVVADREVHVTSRYQISRGLERLGHQVRCLMFYEGEKPQDHGLSHVRFLRVRMGRWTTPLRKMARAFHAMLWSRNQVVLYEPSLWPAAAAAFCLRLGRLPLVMDIRTVPVDLPKGFKGWLRRTFLYELALKAAARMSRGLTVITPTLRDEVCQALGWPEDRVGIWSSGVDVDLFQPLRPAGESTEDDFDLCAAYHGVLSPNRGLQEVIPALRLLKREGLFVRLLLVGDGPARKKLELLAEGLGVADQVEFTGKVPYHEIPGWLDQCDVGIVPLPDHPGWRVSSPLKLMEYCAMARPVILSSIKAHLDVVKGTPGAIYLDKVSPEHIASALRQAHDEKRALDQAGAANRILVTARHSWEAQAQKLQDYLMKSMVRS